MACRGSASALDHSLRPGRAAHRGTMFWIHGIEMSSIFQKNGYWYKRLWDIHRDRPRRRRQERPYILEHATLYDTTRGITRDNGGCSRKRGPKNIFRENLTDFLQCGYRVRLRHLANGGCINRLFKGGIENDDCGVARRTVSELDTKQVERIPRMGLQRTRQSSAIGF